MYIIAAFYRFAHLPDVQAMQDSLRSLLALHQIKGTVIVATEGINGTIAGSREAIDAFKEFILSDARLKDAEYKESFAQDCPFKRLKVKIKNEIVTMGMGAIDVEGLAGMYVGPEQWHVLLNDPEVIVLDVRNDFEVAMGTFKNAINPKTDSFRQFPDFVKTQLAGKEQRKIAMSCTGGIRCEKASAYMKMQGFLHVYHLKGGVLQYLADVSPERSLWQGDCFIFDERVALDHELLPFRNKQKDGSK